MIDKDKLIRDLLPEVWWCYLHINGNILAKRIEPADSPFIKRKWIMNSNDRRDGWRVVLEAAYLGARSSQLQKVMKSWNITREDLMNYIKREINSLLIGCVDYVEYLLNFGMKI